MTMLTDGQNDSSGAYSLHNVRIRNWGRTITDLKAIQSATVLEAADGRRLLVALHLA